MKKSYFETTVGFFVIILTVVFSIYFYKNFNRKTDKNYYNLYAIFSNIEGINLYSKVKLGGMEVGEVEDLILDGNYKIVLKLKIKNSFRIPTDSVLKISTSGIIGNKYLKLEAGGEDEVFLNGGYFQFTESAMDLEDMISRFMLNKISEKQ
ncbi:MAG: MlaD family protein [Rickettsiales bacterium]|jgi:phospholipid/cholesterol/gamma-HCH transport system substrate-binding protein|nr:MlaD family protein [Rickettsiales bacterium]